MFKKSLDRNQSNAEKYQARKQKFGTDDVMPLWVADMDIATPSFIMDALKKRLKHPILGYEAMPDSAFEAQITWMKKRHGLELKRDDMFYSPSVLTSLNLTIQAFSEKGDEIIIQPPVYGAFASSIKNNQRSVVDNPLYCDEENHYTFDLEDLERKITQKTKLLLLCSPHNPVGRVWTQEELTQLAQICLKHDIKVVADEIHCDISYKKHTPFASLSKKISEQTITLLSPGKTFNISGLHISTLTIANQEMKKRFTKVYQATALGTGNILAHVAFEHAYLYGETWLDALLQHLQANINKLDDLFKEDSYRIQFQKPEATFLAWLDCKKMHLNETELNDFFIYTKKLGLSIGSSFGKEGRGYMRLNFGITEEEIDRLLLRFD
ncbi:PatB family C-S lyase [bacterium]|nr:PatB family C-S lyase [bacterium]MBU1958446.1 PatB family C-S lyase [bacterium]